MTRIRNIARLTAGPVRDRGLRETLRSIRLVRSARRREVREGFDQRFGTDTSRTFQWSDLEATGPDVPPLWRYFPVMRADFDPLVDALDIRLEDFVFVDLGSGKGRALLFASDWPFQRVVGVELSPTLHAIAENNVRVYASPTQRCDRFELVCCDAAEWQPPEENLLLYLFQPFPENVFDRVMANLEASLALAPRPVVIMYLNPVFERALLRPGWLQDDQEGGIRRRRRTPVGRSTRTPKRRSAQLVRGDSPRREQATLARRHTRHRGILLALCDGLKGQESCRVQSQCSPPSA